MKVGLESVIAIIDENVRMIIVHFVRRDMCATWWKVFYRKFVYFLNVWREFPLGRPTMKWLYHWLSSSTRDISTFRISLFSSPFTIYLLSSDLYPPLVINREKSDTALPLTKFKIKQPVLSNTKRDHSSNTLLRDRIFECDKITCSWYLYFPSFFLSFYFDRFVSKYRALENFPQTFVLWINNEYSITKYSIF